MASSGGQTNGRGRLSRGVDRSLPWVAGGSVVAGVAITAFSDVPRHLPGIALDSSSLFLVERGGAVVVALIIATGLVGRTLKRELPTGFSPATGAVTYADKVEAAASASDAAVAALKGRLDTQDQTLDRLDANVDKFAEALTIIAADVETLKNEPAQPET